MSGPVLIDDDEWDDPELREARKAGIEAAERVIAKIRALPKGKPAKVRRALKSSGTTEVPEGDGG